MAGRLRILMVIPQLGFGGAEGSFLRLAQYIAGHADVTIAVIGEAYSDNELSDTGEWTDRPVVFLDSMHSDRNKVLRWWWMLMRLRELKRQHDVTISFLSGVNLLNALAGPRRKTIVSERGSKRHDIGMKGIKRMIWTRFLDPLTYWRAGRVVAASEGLAHEIIAANPWASSRVTAIEGTIRAEALVDAADLPVEMDFLPLAEYETVVTYGRLHVQKGYDVLLAAFARVRAERPAARLLLIGEGPEYFNLRKLAEDLGLRVSDSSSEADVIIPGKRSDPIRYLKLGRLFAFPSRYEGLPNALIEALAAGVPVLASDCPWGPRSILSGGEHNYSGPEPSLPLFLSNGVLMPLPDAAGAVEIWAAGLDHALQTVSEPAQRQERLATVARYDIEVNGPAWLRIADDLARSDVLV